MMSRARFSLLAVLAVTASLLAPGRPPAVLAARPIAPYTIIDIGVLPGLRTTSAWWPQAMSNAGHIAAYSSNGGLLYDLYSGNIPCVWSPSRGLQPLPTLPGKVSGSAFSLNDHDQLVGSSGNDYLDNHPVLWDRGRIYNLGILPGETSGEAWSINNRGQAVGISYSFVNDTPLGWGFPWESQWPCLWENGQLRVLPGGQGSGGAINDQGQVAGSLLKEPGDFSHSKAVLWDKNGITDLGSIGGDIGYANAINNQTQITGQGTNALGEYHGWLWKNGVMTDLGTLGGTYSGAWGVNAQGIVIGEATNANGVDHAVLWKNGVIQDLNDLIPANSGWELQNAQGINDRGQITGGGVHIINGVPQFRTWLLTPTQ